MWDGLNTASPTTGSGKGVNLSLKGKQRIRFLLPDVL